MRELKNYSGPLGAGEDTFADWIYDEHSADVIEKIMQKSALESVARGEPMNAAVKTVPRGGGFAVAVVGAGGAYSLATGTADNVELTARKIGGAVKINDEDLNDTRQIDPLLVKRHDAARELAVFVDNAAFGTTAASNGTTVPFVSVYRAVRTGGDSGSLEASYVADDNYLSITTANMKATLSGATTGFGLLDQLLAKYEQSEFFDEENTYVVASHRFRTLLRNVKDGQGNPYLIRRETGDGIARRPLYDIFGYNTVWTRGANTSAAVNTTGTTGNPLLIIGNSRMLIRGDASLVPGIPASQPGFSYQNSRDGIGFLNDQGYMKAAVRRGFAVGTRLAHAVLEVTP